MPRVVTRHFPSLQVYLGEFSRAAERFAIGRYLCALLPRRRPIHPNDEVPVPASQDHNLVRSTLRNPVKRLNNLGVMERREGTSPAMLVKFNDEHTLGISRQLQTAVCGEVVVSNCLNKGL